MSQVIEMTVYTFDELSDAAKKHARQNFADTNRDYPYDNWWSFEGLIEAAGWLGVKIANREWTDVRGKDRSEPKIHFSGFSSQGDGASFVGSYSCAPNAVKDVAENWPKDETLNVIAAELTTLQVRAKLEYGQTVSCDIDNTSCIGNYYHSGTMGLTDLRVALDDAGDLRPTDKEESELLDIMRRLADWMYHQLEEQYDWHFSDECLDGYLQDETFDADGDIIEVRST